ncbi:MAG: penicillin acylase family protein [Desulfurococcales archaeon]|nr:penicillin acylase family protein [Desulfurococcales archaeon]
MGVVGRLVSVLGVVIVIGLIVATPLGQLLSIMDPFRGVAASASVGVLSGEMSIESSYLGSEVRVVFDGNFVPHIFAESERDAFYAMGYVHAWFRLWQMDVQRRLASGRLAEIVGEDALESDVFMRTIGLRRSAETTAEWIRANVPEVYELLEAYSRGVNDAIGRMEREGRLPLLFKLLDYKPEPWSPADSIVWAKYMAWSLTNFWEPLILSYLAVKLGPEDVNLLWPVHPYYSDNVTVVPGDGEINGKRIPVDPYYLRGLNWFEEWATGLDFEDPEFASRLEEAVLDILELVGERPREIGSNNWAVSPSRSTHGAAMMADDPHLPLNIPSLWFAVHIKAGDLDVYGVTLPGIPFVIIGYNRYISWGLTNTQIGVMDFYVEQVSPEDPTLYYHDGEWKRMREIREVIKVRGGEDYELVVYETVHGPVLTRKGLTISFRWTGNAGFMNDGSGVTREAVAIYLVNKARSLEEFVEALKYWDVPSQNFMYADVYGNIAVYEPGIFPLRKVTLPDGREILVVGSRSVLNGTGPHDWIGYVPFEDVPHAVNPERGFLAAPNQMSVGPYYPYFILGAWWDSPNRAQAIFRLLESKEMHSVDDMKRYQGDTYNWAAAMMLPVMIKAVEERASGKALEALEILSRWDYMMDKGEVAPTLWWAWFSALQDELYRDYLLERGVGYRFYPPVATTIYLVRELRDSEWFRGGFEATVQRALDRAIRALEEKLGPNIEDWEWGRVHQLLLMHLSQLDALSRGPYPVDGSSNVLMNAGFPWDLEALEGGVYVRTGPSWRIVALMESPDSCIVYGIYPGGQSGNPVSDRYDDWVDEWLNNEYFTFTCASSPGDLEETLGSVTFKPEG